MGATKALDYNKCHLMAGPPGHNFYSWLGFYALQLWPWTLSERSRCISITVLSRRNEKWYPTYSKAIQSTDIGHLNNWIVSSIKIQKPRQSLFISFPEFCKTVLLQCPLAPQRMIQYPGLKVLLKESWLFNVAVNWASSKVIQDQPWR